MKRLLPTFCAALLAFSAVPALAATPSAGDLIKGPGDTVYYYGQNSQRYVFPTANTYFTWYADFSTVKTISAGDLASIPLAGNVTYRPGVKLVKITTDPKVYAVSSRGTLRWIETEAAATALYGADWNKKIDDVPDAFFINYTMGPSIKNASDFSPSAQMDASLSINIDKQLSGIPAPAPAPAPAPTTPAATSTPSVPVTPVATSTSPLTFNVTATDASPGDIETLSATYLGNDIVAKLELFFGNQLITTCHSPSCSADTPIPQSGTQPTYLAEGRVTLVNGTVVSSTQMINVHSGNVSSAVNVTLGRPMIKPGQLASISASVDVSYIPIRVDIFVDDSNVYSCVDGSGVCNWGGIINGAEGSQHPVYAKMTDYLGRTYTSLTRLITLSSKNVPIVTVTPAKTQIYAGETVDVTAFASSDIGITSIDVLKDGIVLKHCLSGAPCTATTGPWSATSTLIFTGSAVDSGNTTGTATSEPVMVTARP